MIDFLKQSQYDPLPIPPKQTQQTQQQQNQNKIYTKLIQKQNQVYNVVERNES